VSDHLGSPRIILGASGSLADTKRRDFMPFGQDLGAGQFRRTTAQGCEPSGTPSNPREKFATYERDDETGLDFAQARYYQNRLGRFTTPDEPFADQSEDDPQSWNLYAYSRNNPLANSDPSGMSYIRNNGTGEIFFRADLNGADDLAAAGYNTNDYSVLQGDVFIDAAGARSLGDAGLEGRTLTFDGNRSPVLGGFADSFLIKESLDLRAIANRLPNEAQFMKLQGAFFGATAVIGGTLGVGAYALGGTGAPSILMRPAANAVARACFVAGMPVATAAGDASIEDIAVGDWVWATNPDTGRSELRRVVETFRHDVSRVIALTIDGETIETTPEHPFWVVGAGWTEAGRLQIGDGVRTLGGETRAIERIEWIEKAVPVYNFTVEGLHTYHVSRLKILVHNKADALNVAKLVDKVGKIAKSFGRTEKEIRDAIHAVKRNMDRGGPVRNPDVKVDLTTGEVYPKTPTGVGDSIGNIFDYLP
jgi:RHS repeat-associated protein